MEIVYKKLTGGCEKMRNHFFQLPFIMGRDPVEYAKRAKYQPPAMRVRGVCYTKKSPFRYNFGCSSLNYNEGKGDFNGQ